MSDENTEIVLQPLPNEVAAQNDGRSNLTDQIITLASNPSIDIDRINQLIQLRDRLEADRAREEFNYALSNAQTEITKAVKNSSNNFIGSKYADYEAVSNVVKPIIEKFNFSLTFIEEPASKDGFIKVTCILARGKFERRYSTEMPLDIVGAKGGTNKNPLQAHGSTITYARRYLKSMIFDITTTFKDDDGNGASNIITFQQAQTIEKMLAERQINKRAFLQFFKVENITDIPEQSFNVVIEKIKHRDRVLAVKNNNMEGE